MNPNLLVDAIVKQTTVLIAQLSTAAGVRSPMAHLADQVFFELSRELEAQGLGKRVVADMFGMLLRGYQKKVQRLTESRTTRDRSLWQAVLEFVTEHPGVSRSRLAERFARDDEEAVGSVLHDLTRSGLVSATGAGRQTLYRPSTAADRRVLLEQHQNDEVLPMVWATIFHQPDTSLAALCEQLPLTREDLTVVLDRLRQEGRVEAADWAQYTGLRAAELMIPVGDDAGWEAAVFDHYQAVANAIAAKVQRRALWSTSRDAIGGATLRFELNAKHPHADEVYALLEETRQRVNVLWAKVKDYNEQHPPDPSQVIAACFYFGQSVVEPQEGLPPALAPEVGASTARKRTETE